MTPRSRPQQTPANRPIRVYASKCSRGATALGLQPTKAPGLQFQAEAADLLQTSVQSKLALR